MANPKFSRSDIVTAFDISTIGTKVVDSAGFRRELVEALAVHDTSKDRVPGQHFVLCPLAVPYVSAGVGPRSKDASRYVCREHRGVVSAYLKREFAAQATGCAVVVYTLDAYLNDPDVTAEEAARVKAEDPTHVIVAVLAFAGPESPLPPYRLVWNLAGGNNEALVWTADEIRAKAKAAIDYDSAWSAVAD